MVETDQSQFALLERSSCMEDDIGVDFETRFWACGDVTGGLDAVYDGPMFAALPDQQTACLLRPRRLGMGDYIFKAALADMNR